MPGLLIVAHAPLATAFRAVAGHVFPDCGRRLGAIDVPADWGADEVERAVRAALEAQGQSQTLILCDVFGATPCNGALRLADGQAVRVVCGVNVPMVWRSLCYADEPLEALVTRAVGGATQGVMPLGSQRPQNQPLHSAGHDQDHAHHQQ